MITLEQQITIANKMTKKLKVVNDFLANIGNCIYLAQEQYCGKNNVGRNKIVKFGYWDTLLEDVRYYTDDKFIVRSMFADTNFILQGYLECGQKNKYINIGPWFNKDEETFEYNALKEQDVIYNFYGLTSSDTFYEYVLMLSDTDPNKIIAISKWLDDDGWKQRLTKCVNDFCNILSSAYSNMIDCVNEEENKNHKALLEEFEMNTSSSKTKKFKYMIKCIKREVK